MAEQGSSRRKIRRRAHPGAALVIALLALAGWVGTGSGELIRETSILLEVPRFATLTITGDVSGLMTLSQDGTGEVRYDAGYLESDPEAVLLSCSTNSSWDLGARLATGWTCPGAYDKPESDLYIRMSSHSGGTVQNGADSYVNLTDSNLQLLAGAAGALNVEAEIQHKILLDWTRDIPGSYSITVTYTLTNHLP
jgi:hypothetical protein